MGNGAFSLMMTYIPVFSNVALAVLFFLVQIPYVRLARRRRAGVVGMSRGITDSFGITLFGPIIISVISFVFYEFYVFFDGAFYLIALLMVFYIIPVFSVIYFICYFVRLMRAAGDGSSFDVLPVLLIVGVLITILFVLLFGWLYLPLSMIAFAVPFFSLPLLSVVRKKH